MRADPPRLRPARRRRWAVALVALSLLPVRLDAGSEEELRVSAGLRLFRYVLAADVDLESKAEVTRDPRGGERRSLLLVVFYTDDERRAREAAAVLAENAVRDLPVEVEISRDADLAELGDRRVAGIFVAQAPPAGVLAQVVRTAVSRSVVAYSPFEGHVEKGVLAGLSIEAQVRPYVNARTLRAAGITLKPFFMKAAKVFG